MKAIQPKQNNHMQKSKTWLWILTAGILTAVFIARALSGYHWLTDIIGSVLLGAVIVSWYLAFVVRYKLPVKAEKVKI